MELCDRLDEQIEAAKTKQKELLNAWMAEVSARDFGRSDRELKSNAISVDIFSDRSKPAVLVTVRDR